MYYTNLFYHRANSIYNKIEMVNTTYYGKVFYYGKSWYLLNRKYKLMA